MANTAREYFTNMRRRTEKYCTKLGKFININMYTVYIYFSQMPDARPHREIRLTKSIKKKDENL